VNVWSKKDEKTEEKPPENKPAAPSAEELLAKMGEMLNPVVESQKQINQRLAAIEESRKPKVEPTEVPSVLENEEAAFTQRLGPMAAAQVLTNARITESEVLNDLRSQGWSEYIPKLKDILSKTPLETKARADYEACVRNFATMLIGEDAIKGGLKRKGNSFILEDANGAVGDPAAEAATQEDRDFLNYEMTTSKGKRVTRREFLTRMGIDVTDPAKLKSVKDDWSKVQVVN
jgi:hypothetical protein